MPRKLPPLNALRAFEAIARHGNLADAAAEMCVTASAVSHQVRQLEDWLGTRLFRTAGRSRRLTPAGRRYAHALTALFDRLDVETRDLRTAGQESALTLSVLPTFAIRWLVPRLVGFHSRHPDIDVRISTTPLPVVDFDDIDAAIRFGDGNWPDLHADFLFAEDMFPVCSPVLLAGPHPLRRPEDLADHALIHTIHRPEDWANWLAAAGLGNAIDPARGPKFELTTMALDAAEAGLGVTVTREAQVIDALRQGRLVAPFARDLLRGNASYLVYPPHHAGRPAIQAFRAWLLEQAAAETWPR